MNVHTYYARGYCGDEYRHAVLVVNKTIGFV